MRKKAKKSGKSSTKSSEYICVAIARSEEEAQDYQVLLKNDNIPAVVRQQSPDDFDTGGFAVLVPEEFADEAYVVVESHDSYEDFYDMGVDEDEDFENDIMDDNY